MERHPLNQSFEWQAPGGPFRRVTDAQATQWSEKGYFLLEDAFDAATVDAVQREIDPWEERFADRLRAAGGSAFIADADAITFTVHLVRRSPALREFVANPVLTDLCHDLIGPDVRLYWDQAVYKKPERKREFPWHQDNGYTFVEPQQYLTCWCALTDATVDNGCPQVLPGAHRMGTLAHHLTPYGWECVEHPDGAVAVEAKAGDIVVFSSLTPHLTGPNLTDHVRKAYIVQYAPDGAMKVTDEGGLELQDDPDRQFLVLDAGNPVSPPPVEAR